MQSDFQCSRCGRARYGSITNGSYDRKNGTTGLVNDGGDKCTDCLEKDPIFHVGQSVTVKAWWLKGKCVPCEVVALSSGCDYLDVRPINGNKHMRFVSIKDVVTEEENHQTIMETLSVKSTE